MQTARVMEALERVVLDELPELAFVPGDVNSTLGAALVFARSASRTRTSSPVAELRSPDARGDQSHRCRRVRLTVVRALEEAVANLASEGIDASRVHFVGNTMIDSLVVFEPHFARSTPQGSLGLERGKYLLVTLHRPSLVDGDEPRRRTAPP